jgi:hypothetical protein
MRRAAAAAPLDVDASLLKAQQAALAVGQGNVDTIIAYVKERAALEETFSRSLQRLSRTTLLLDGAAPGAQRARKCALSLARSPAHRPRRPTPLRHLPHPHVSQRARRTRLSSRRSRPCAAT